MMENTNSNRTEINFEEFTKVDLRVGIIVCAENLEGYKKILKITVDIGGEKRVIMSGLAKFYKPEEIVNKCVIVCTNLAPRKFGEQTSNGMILAATNEDGKPVLLTVLQDVKPGSQVS
jgi:methionine--tRNA ligase beta chain